MEDNKQKHDSINKNQLAEIVSDKTNISYETCLALINVTFDTIMESLEHKKKVRIVGFGDFDFIERKARNGINPDTRKPMIIPNLTSPTFRAGSQLKKAVKGNRLKDYHADVVLAKDNEKQSKNY